MTGDAPADDVRPAWQQVAPPGADAADAAYESIFWSTALERSWPWLARLGLLPPAVAWDVISTLRSAEADRFEADEVAGFEDLLRSTAHLVPRIVEQLDVDDFAHRYAIRRTTYPAHEFFLLCMAQAGRTDEVLDHGDVHAFEEARRQGPVVALPLHVGPAIQATVGYLVSRGVPTTVIAEPWLVDVMSRVPAEAFPAGEHAVLPRSSGGLVAARRALRRGHVVAISPDVLVDPSVANVVVPFMGGRIRAPIGPRYLAEKAGAAMIPYYIRDVAPGRYRVEWLRPLDMSLDPVACLGDLFEQIEHHLLADRPWDWVGWRMLGYQSATDGS